MPQKPKACRNPARGAHRNIETMETNVLKRIAFSDEAEYNIDKQTRRAGFRHAESGSKVTYTAGAVSGILGSEKYEERVAFMDKKKGIRVLVMAAVFLFLFSAAPVKADAAKLDRTSVILLKGRTASIKLKKYPKKTKKFAWKKSGKAVKIVKKRKGMVKVKAVKCGTSAVKIRSGKKTLECRVTVIGKNAGVKLDKGTGSTLELGARVAEVASSNPKIVKAVNQGTSVKLTALRSGTAKVMAILAGGKVIKVEINVPGKGTDNPAGKVTPDTEPGVEVPGTEAKAETVETGAQTPSTETSETEAEMPDTGEASITDRPRLRIGAYYYCNSDQHDYANFLPRFLAANLTTMEANDWINDLNEEAQIAIQQHINKSNYSDEYKAELLAVLRKDITYDDATKAELTTKFFDEFDKHYHDSNGFLCTASSSSDRNIYVYGEWTQIPGNEYEAWKKENIK